MEESVNDRIEIIINHQFGGNKSSFAKAIGIPPTAISSYLGKQRRSKPNIEMIVNVVKASRVNPWWLLTGEGDWKSEIFQILDPSVNTHGDNSPASGTGDVTVNVHSDGKTTELFEKLIAEKDLRIAELKEVIEMLKQR